MQTMQHALADHCNLKCDECSTRSPFLKKSYSELDSFKRDIERFAPIVQVGRFEFMGGEPLLNKQVDDFIQVVKDSGIATRIGVFTNGKLLPKMSDRFFDLIDDIMITAYPNSGIDYKKVRHWLVKKQETHNFTLSIDIKKDFFVVYKAKDDDADRVKKVFDECVIAHDWKCTQLKDGYFYRCTFPYMKHKFDGFDHTQDGVDVHSDEFPTNFYNYMRYQKPMEACKYCNAMSGPTVPHSQIINIKEMRKNLV